MKLSLVALIAVVVLAGCGAIGAYISHLEHRLTETRTTLAAAQREAQTQQVQARIEREAAQISDLRAQHTGEARQAANTHSIEVLNAPDLDTALAAYLNGLDLVRASGHAAVAPGVEPDAGRQGVGG